MYVTESAGGCRMLLTVVQLDGGGAWRSRLTGWDDLYDVFTCLAGLFGGLLDGHISFIR